MTEFKRIAVLINTRMPYRCDIIRGIADYARKIGNWTFSIDPFAFNYYQRNPHSDIVGDAIIADVNSQDLADDIIASGLPAVNICGSLRKVTIPRVIPAVAGLASNPFPTGVRKLRGSAHTYRLRVGEYRVVYGSCRIMVQGSEWEQGP